MAVSFFVKKGSGFPTGDDFSEGIGDWTGYASDSDATMDWYQNNSLRLSINLGSAGEQDGIQSVWKYALLGDFDMEVGYQRLTQGPIGPQNCNDGFLISPVNDGSFNNNAISVLNVASLSLMRSIYVLDGVVQQIVDNSTKPVATLNNLRLRITKVGSIFTTYHDPSTGSWEVVSQFNAPDFENVVIYPVFNESRSSSTYVSTKFYNFKVNSGIVELP